MTTMRLSELDPAALVVALFVAVAVYRGMTRGR